jgi:hypothetical protein
MAPLFTLCSTKSGWSRLEKSNDPHQRFALQFVVLLLVLFGCRVAAAYGCMASEKIKDGWKSGSLGSVNRGTDFIRDLCRRTIKGSYRRTCAVLLRQRFSSTTIRQRQ